MSDDDDEDEEDPESLDPADDEPESLDDPESLGAMGNGGGEAAAVRAPEPNPNRLASTPQVTAMPASNRFALKVASGRLRFSGLVGRENTQVRSRTNRMRVAARLASTSIATSTVRDGSATRPCNASNAPLVMPSVIAKTTSPWS